MHLLRLPVAILMALALTGSALAVQPWHPRAPSSGDLRIEIRAPSVIGCRDLIEVAVTLRNTADHAIRFYSSWTVPRYNVDFELKFEDGTVVPTTQIIEFKLDPVWTNNLTTLLPAEFVGRVFLFRLNAGELVLENRRQLDPPHIVETLAFGVGDKSFSLEAFYSVVGERGETVALLRTPPTRIANECSKEPAETGTLIDGGAMIIVPVMSTP